MVRVQGGGDAREPSRRSRSPGEGGGPVTACSRRCGGRRPAAGCRGRAVVSRALVAPGRVVGGENPVPGRATGPPAPWPVPSLSGRTVPACGRTAGAAVASRWAEASVLTARGRGGRLIHSRPPAEPADGARSGRGVLPARRGKAPGRERAPRRGKTPRAGLWGCWAARAARRDRRRPGGRSGPPRGAAERRTTPGTRRAARRPRRRPGARSAPRKPGRAVRTAASRGRGLLPGRDGRSRRGGCQAR